MRNNRYNHYYILLRIIYNSQNSSWTLTVCGAVSSAFKRVHNIFSRLRYRLALSFWEFVIKPFCKKKPYVRPISRSFCARSCAGTNAVYLKFELNWTWRLRGVYTNRKYSNNNDPDPVERQIFNLLWLCSGGSVLFYFRRAFTHVYDIPIIPTTYVLQYIICIQQLCKIMRTPGPNSIRCRFASDP